MRTKSFVWPMLIVLAASAAAPVAALGEEATGEKATGEKLVDALNGIFGKHAGLRAAHSHGICVKGSFTPTAESAGLSKAPHFATAVPVLGRFSMGGGNPKAPNTQQDNARGLALRFDFGKDTTDMVMISAPVFPARDPDQFLTLLRTVAPGPDGKQDADKIKAFFEANPESTRQGAWLKARPVPASYASASYFGVHTFTLTNAKGESRIIKWKAVPVGGEQGLTDDEVKEKAFDFYLPELTERLAKGPAAFDLTAILGEEGDERDDPTVLWPDERKSVTMGTVEITSLEDNAVCDEDTFDPTRVVDGVAGPANDKIYPMRSRAYAVSLTRRLTPE